MLYGLMLLAGGSLATGSMSLPQPQLAIALRVAGAGLPDCVRYDLVGTEMPCMPRFSMRPGFSVNAWSKDGSIAFTHSATRRLTQDQFALLAGHEIAHWYLGHHESNPIDELAADEMGAKLACQAGFSPKAGVGLFKMLGVSKSHPKPSVRRITILSVRCDKTVTSKALNPKDKAGHRGLTR